MGFFGRLKDRFSEHTLVETFRELKGNPKVVIMTQPLWSIPNVLYAPFATIYMYSLGLSDVNIGFILTVGMISQMLFALLGGIVTDKIGRRKTQAIFDLIGWFTPCLLWAFSQNFIWFLVAQIFNGGFQVTTCSFNCLFTEDCPPKHLLNVFTFVQIAGMMSIFFSPIAIVLVANYDMQFIIRCIYLFAAVCMLAKAILLYTYGEETSVGRVRIEETKSIPFFTMFKQYGGVFLKIIKSKQTRLVLLIMIMTNIYTIAIGSFFSLYVTNELNLPQQYIAIFPMIRGALMLCFTFTIQRFASRFPMKNCFAVGIVSYIIGHLILIFAPSESMSFVVIYTMLEAIGFAMVVPRRDALVSLSLDPKERARMYATLSVTLLCITAPFASLIGFLSQINRRLPFMFNIVVFVGLMSLIVSSKTITKIDAKQRGL